jgi:hypothetical protein
MPAHSFLGPSPVGLITVFYCPRFKAPPTWRARSLYLYLPGTGWPSYTPGTGLPFRRLLWFAGLRWRYSNLPPRGELGSNWLLEFSLYNVGTNHIKNTASSSSLLWLHVYHTMKTVFSLSLPSSGWLLLLNHTVVMSHCSLLKAYQFE